METSTSTTSRRGDRPSSATLTPAVIAAVRSAAERGTSFGIPHALETDLARTICAWVPSVKKVRLTNSGTEATMTAIRLARGFTGRDKIIKFEGCYHGHVDSLLVKAGSGALTLGQPDSAGIPAALAHLTITLPFNDAEALRTVFRQQGGEIAAVIVEPIPANAGLIPPQSGFLETMRELCTAHGTVLIFDEVMTGFRLGRGGAQELLGVMPDLTCFGKVIGGGLPVGAVGGRAEIMDFLAPAGPVYQAGTLSGNPLAMAAGLAQLRGPRGGKHFSQARGAWRGVGAGNARRAEGGGSGLLALSLRLDVLPLLHIAARAESRRCAHSRP